MANYKELFTRHLDAEGVKYTHLNEYSLEIACTGRDKDRICVMVRFDPNGRPIVLLVCSEICNVANHEAFGMRACNEANRRYGWVKFHVDEEGDILATVDAYLEESTCGTVCFELTKRIIKTVDEAYRIFVGEVWA